MAEKLASHFIEMTQDACLKAFWRRSALRTFLKQHGISEGRLATWHVDETKREFLRRLFDDLIAISGTSGHQVILGMSRSLAEMRHFPDLEGWADSKEKIVAAKEAIARIKEHVDSLNQQVRAKKESEERQRIAREQREQVILAQQTLAGLTESLNELVSKQGTQEGGYEFEKWFYDLANYFELPARPPYKARGRQIDGSVGLDGTDFLVETKFTKTQTKPEEIDAFMSKIQRKADNTMGIFLSMAGFSSQAVNEASCDRTPMLLMDHSHIYSLILSESMTLLDVIRRIKQHASQTGEAFLAVSRFSG